ncbi:BACON domain-containing protein [uncultured Bacteroides sp.]|uniref:BACON domain-containing protein n=1 Tax=uncultured Bacteroides sp. TaxID=162156 RepID=UPI0025D89CAE|nr:BACON domain-containing protein [uncultured Bacteroides sp.]
MTHIKYLFGALLALLMLGGCGNDSDYIIESNPNEFAIYPIAIPVSADGGTYELKVTGNEAWTAELTGSNSSAASWCTLSETSGTGTKVITLTVKPSNSFVKQRSIIVNVSSSTKKLKSRVLQETMVLGEDEVLINGLVWSTKNVGAPGTFAASPDDPGMYYQFNRKVGYPSGPQDDPAPAGWPADYKDDGTNWLPENDPSPEGWRVPTTAEMVALWEIGATWVSAEQTGFSTDGLIIGVPEATAKRATKDNLKQLGCLFLPQSGWRNEFGIVDRGWLCAVRSGTSLSSTHGGMSLGDMGGYRDTWGWGDGHKVRAAMIRPVKNVQVED